MLFCVTTTSFEHVFTAFFLSLVEACKHEKTISAHFLPQHATFEIPIKWQRVNSCAFCGGKSIVPPVII